MHLRYAIIIAVTLTFFATLTLRHHIRDLAEVTSTYSSFYPYLRRHPGTLHRYSASSQTRAPAGAPPLVPPILHHVFLAEGDLDASLSKYDAEIQSCQSLHTNWTNYVWNDTTADSFMQQHYPDLFPHYKSYPQRIQRANILRYAVLHHYGGVYLDLDITCLQPLDDLRTLPWLTPGAHPAGVNNAFILARPRHPLLEQIIARIPSRDIRWGFPYIENMLSTGCMFFSNRWTDYARPLAKKIERGEKVEEGYKIYVLADEFGGLEAHMLRGTVTTPLFRHGGASSWHGWDATAILLVGDHYGYVLLFIGGLLFSTIASLASRMCFRRGHRRQRSCSPLHGSPRRSSKSDDEEKQLGGRRASAETRLSFFALRRSISVPLPHKE